jgi:hypothetical protein
MVPERLAPQAVLATPECPLIEPESLSNALNKQIPKNLQYVRKNHAQFHN